MNAIFWLLVSFGLLATVVALWKGGPAERWAVIVYLVIYAGAEALCTSDKKSELYLYQQMAADFLLAFCFLVLSVRYSNYWLAVAMVACGLGSWVHAYTMEESFLDRASIWGYFQNMLFLAMCGSVLVASLASWRSRVRARRLAAERKKSQQMNQAPAPSGLPDAPVLGSEALGLAR